MAPMAPTDIRMPCLLQLRQKWLRMNICGPRTWKDAGHQLAWRPVVASVALHRWMFAIFRLIWLIFRTKRELSSIHLHSSRLIISIYWFTGSSITGRLILANLWLIRHLPLGHGRWPRVDCSPCPCVSVGSLGRYGGSLLVGVKDVVFPLKGINRGKFWWGFLWTS